MSIFLAALLLNGFPLQSDHGYSEAIGQTQRQIAKAASQEKALLQGRLAVLYWKDQNPEEAITVFLEALKKLPAKTKAEPSPEEDALYTQALAFYLEQGASSAQAAATQLLEKYEPVLSLHGDYHLLRFLIAVAYANLGQYDDFFDHFFTAYTFYPDHYMAYKTRAMLHVKLFERAPTLEEKERQSQQVIRYASEALKKYPGDHGLYKLLIGFSKEEDKGAQVKFCLDKIIRNNIVIPRSELPFYVQQCIITNQKEVGRAFIAKAREWYPFSRAIAEAEKDLRSEE